VTNVSAGRHDISPASLPTEILVAIDFSTAGWSVVPLALDVAARCSIPIRFVHVDTSSPWIMEGIGGRLRLRAAPGGRMVDIDVVPGTDVPEAIQALRVDQGSTAVALATRGRNGLAELAMGSVCEQLLVTYDAPVLAVGPRFDSHRHAEIHRVVTCLDFKSPSTALLDEGVAWAEQLGVPLTMLSVSGEPAHGPEHEESYQLVSDILDRLPATTVPVDSDVLTERDPAPAIVRYAEHRQGTLLVLATHARRPLVRAMTHSVTRQVARDATCGMLLLRATSRVRCDPLPLTREDRRTSCHDEYEYWKA
jgi:nucleotide-binding universal stress UspA family protein